jgi:hypothetical protein
VQHVVWSTLEDSRRFIKLEDARMPTLMGKYKVPHFDVKGEADDYFRGTGVPTTFLLTSFYWDNLIHIGMGPRAGPDGKLYFALPIGTRPLPGIAAWVCPARRTSATCFSSIMTSAPTSAVRAASSSRARSTRSCRVLPIGWRCTAAQSQSPDRTPGRRLAS